MAQMDRFNKNYAGKDDLVDAASMIFQIVDMFSYKNYTKEQPEFQLKDWFTIEDLRPKPQRGWEKRFVS
jgi:hypothetical protein